MGTNDVRSCADGRQRMMHALGGLVRCRQFASLLCGVLSVATSSACSSDDGTLAPGVGRLALSVARVDFDTVKVGEDSLRAVTIRNTGDRAINLCLPYLAGDDCGSATGLDASSMGFEWPLSDMIWSLAAGSKATFNIRFAPTVSGTVGTTLRLAHDGVGSPASLELSGFGEGDGENPLPEPEPGGCQVVASTRALNFGESLPGVDRALLVSIANKGDVDCAMDPVALSGDAAFSTVEAPSGTWILAPDAKAEVRVVYHSSTEGAHHATLSFGTTDATVNDIDVALEGESSAVLPLELAPRTLDLGRALVDCDAPTGYVRVHNDTASAQSVSGFAWAPGSSPAFTLLFVDSPLFDIPAHGFLEFDVIFRPATSGEHSGIAFVDLADGTRLAVPLHGIGVGMDTNTGTGTEVDRTVTEVYGVPGAAPADIVFVVEMTEETSQQREHLVEAFPTLLAAFEDAPTPIDYRIAIAAMGADSSGHFLRTPSGAFAITPTTQDPEGLFRALMRPDDVPPDAALLNPEAGSLYDALGIAFRAISDPVAGRENAGFLRDEASLSVVVLTTDETPYVSGTKLEPVFDFVGHFKGKTRGEGRARLHAIVATEDAINDNSSLICETDDGWGWYAPLSVDVAMLTGGRAASICQPYETTLTELAPYLAGRSSRFWLTGRPLPSTIQVRVNGVTLSPNAWVYTDADDSVTLLPGLAMTDEVSITYDLLECSP